MITAIIGWFSGSRVAMIGLLCALGASLALNGVQTLRLAHEQTDHAQDNAAHAQDIAKLASKALQDTEAARIEGERRFKAQQDITDETIAQRDKAAADAVTAAAAGSKLQNSANILAAQLRAATAYTATAELRASTSATAGVLAELLGRVEQAGRAMAATATERGIAGTACQRQYDSLANL